MRIQVLLSTLLLSTLNLFAAQQTINVGATGGDGTGDPNRTAWIKANANFTDLYAQLATINLSTNAQAYVSNLVATANLTFAGNGAGLTNLPGMKNFRTDFGALGGTNNDQAAWAAAAASGTTVYFDNLTNWQISATVYPTNGTHFISRGAHIISTGTAWTFYCASNLTDVGFDGLVLDGGGGTAIPSSAGTGYGIALPSSLTNGYVRDCTFTGFSGYSLIVYGNYSYTVTYSNPVIDISGNVFRYCWQGPDLQSLTGIGNGYGDAEYMHLVNNDVFNCGIGAYIASGNHFLIGWRITDCGIGLNIEPSENPAHGTVADCTINHNATNVFCTSFDNGFSFIGCNFEGSGYEVMHQTHGVRFQDCILSGQGIIADGGTNYVIANGTVGGLPPITLTNGGVILLEGNYDTFSTTNLTEMDFNHYFTGSNNFAQPPVGNGGGWTNLNTTNLAGNLQIASFNGGTNAGSSNYWRGDGTWASVATGTNAQSPWLLTIQGGGYGLMNAGPISATSFTGAVATSNLVGVIPGVNFPAALPALSGINLTSLTAGNFVPGGILTVLDGGALTNLNANHLTGALPPISGANLTGVTDASALHAAENLADVANANSARANISAAYLGGSASVSFLASQLVSTSFTLAEGGVGSQAADATIAISATGITNTFVGKNAIAYLTCTAVTSYVTNFAGACVLTNSTLTANNQAFILQPNGVIHAASGLSGTLVPW